MAMIQREQVIDLIKRLGPVVPNDLRKKLEVDTMLIGAVLSELTTRNILKITNLKKGSSPFYYLPGQEQQLESLTNYLNEKDQRTANWLKEVKVIPDKNLDLLKRVSLRKIIDFAKPLKAIDDKGSEILFWRYFLFPEQDAIYFLKNGGKEKEEVKPEIIEEKKAEPIQTKLKETIEISKDSTNNILQQKEMDLKLKQQITKDLQETTIEIPEPNFTATTFYNKVIAFFKENNIKVTRQDEISKKEYEFLIKIPSCVGEIVLLARALDKKKLKETDIAQALLTAKMLDVSCLFLITGEFSKKALIEINKLYTGLIINKLD